MVDESKCLKLKDKALEIWKDTQIMELEMLSIDELLEKYNTIHRERDEYRRECRMLPGDIDELYRGIFDGALLKIVAAMTSVYKKLEQEDSEGAFQYRELIQDIRREFPDPWVNAIVEFEHFSAFDRKGLDAKRIAEQIKDKGELLSLIHI